MTMIAIQTSITPFILIRFAVYIALGITVWKMLIIVLWTTTNHTNNETQQ